MKWEVVDTLKERGDVIYVTLVNHSTGKFKVVKYEREHGDKKG